MSNRKGAKSRFNANKRLPEGLGSLLIAEVMNLGSSPKELHLKSEFLKKFVSDDTAPAIVRRQRAINKWLATERENEGTNVRLINQHQELIAGVKADRFFEHLQSVVASVIGDTVPDEAFIGGFSGGASTSRSRTMSHPAQKYLGQAHVTSRCSEYLDTLSGEAVGWSSWWDNHVKFVEVPGNVMFTVPKTTDIDRCACKEPDINMYLQKGAGRIIRQCLRNRGIDLNDQSRNRSLARRGSISGSLATVDLSSASDSVSRELVFQALPIAWFTHLDAIRSEITMIDGEVHVNEMFSSMGNGFTFELESLLFYSIAKTVAYFTGTKGIISVYGDDIIAPTQMYHALEEALNWCGFSVNTDKSFFAGSFRESCGGHFINGLDVTPFYVREPIDTVSDLIKFANGFRRWSETCVDGICDPDNFPLWDFARSFIPEQLWGGHESGDRYQLYSATRPRKRLHVETREQTTGTGGYLHWLNSTVWRPSLNEAVVTSTATSEAPDRRMIYRRAGRTVVPDIPLFPQELWAAECEN